MIDPQHLLDKVIRPTLKYLDLWKPKDERLILGTACKESECGRWLVQLGDVPNGGLGIYQMEKATHDDCWANFINYKPALRSKIIDLQFDSFAAGPDDADAMIGNLYYATAMCRVKYLRDSQPIPEDLPGQAAYWKRVYNTPLGAGTEAGYISAWKTFVGNIVL